MSASISSSTCSSPIFAVAAIMAFLLWVVVPLFTGGRVESVRQYEVAGLPAEGAMTTADEYRTIGLTIGRILHAIGLSTAARKSTPPRLVGTLLTWIGQLVAGLACLYYALV